MATCDHRPDAKGPGWGRARTQNAHAELTAGNLARLKRGSQLTAVNALSGSIHIRWAFGFLVARAR